MLPSPQSVQQIYLQIYRVGISLDIHSRYICKYICGYIVDISVDIQSRISVEISVVMYRVYLWIYLWIYTEQPRYICRYIFVFIVDITVTQTCQLVIHEGNNHEIHKMLEVERAWSSRKTGSLPHKRENSTQVLFFDWIRTDQLRTA